jgi:hypothetical protein
MRLKLLAAASVGIAATLVINPNLAAHAKQIFTGADIIDGTLTGADIQDGSVQAKDIQVSSLPSSGNGTGATTYEWNPTFTGNGPTLAVLTTDTKFAPHTVLTPISFVVSGDFSSCVNGSDAQVSFGEHSGLVGASTNGASTYEPPFFQSVSTGDVEQPLKAEVTCSGVSGPIAAPAFSLKVIFESRPMDASNPTVIH